MTEWRPENWNSIKILRCIHCQGIPKAGIKGENCDTCPTNIQDCQKDFEAGANAMLESLKTFSLMRTTTGWLIFIPEVNNERT